MAAPEKFASSRRWDYAEHRVVEDLPHLQWLGEGLEILTIEMLFHASFMDPAAQLAALIAAGSDHSARALVFGNGEHRGYFVVTGIQTASTQMDAAGAPIAITVNATLRQWAPGSEIDPNAPPRQQFAPIGMVFVPPQSTARLAPTPIAARTPSALAPGVSSLLYNHQEVGPATPNLMPADVSAHAIVRTAF
jgi:phage protein U